MPRTLLNIIVASLVIAMSLVTAPRAEPAEVAWIVTLDAPATSEDVEVLKGIALGVHAYKHIPAAVVVAAPGSKAILAGLPGVKGVYPNQRMQWLLDESTRFIRADHVWNDPGLGYTGEGIGIAIVDAGVDGSHPDLCAAIEFCNGTDVKTVQNVKVLGRQSIAEPVVVLEDQISTDSTSGHGSHVAGIAAGAGTASQTAGRYRGVAHGSKIIGLGTGEVAEVDTVLGAFDWILDNHADYNIKVVNNSWGPGPGHPFDPNEPVQLGIAALHDAGMTVVFGAGNSGPSTDSLNAFSANPKAISAAASSKSGHLALFSSRGVPGSDLWRPTVTTPGQFIASVRARTGFYAWVADATGPDPLDPILPPDNVSYAYASGTSMAAPHVAGIVALMQEASWVNHGRYLTPDEVRNILQNTAVSAEPARGPGGLPYYQDYSMGAGGADALGAVNAVIAGTDAASYDDGNTYDVRAFSGQIGDGIAAPNSFEVAYNVVAGAISLDVMVDWSAAAQDIDILLYRPDNSLYLSTVLHLGTSEGPNQYSSWATSVPNERINVASPQVGTWRAVIKGTVSASEAVAGMWSVVYPDGAAPGGGPVATTIDLTGPAAPVLTGQTTQLSAVVRDASGNPMPNADVTWTVAGVGTLTAAETVTDAQGLALATAYSTSPGTQTVTVQSGSASANLDVTWIGATLPPTEPPPPPPPVNSPGKANGGGHVMDPDKHSFAFHANYELLSTGPDGKLQYNDHAGTKVHGYAVTLFRIENGNHVIIEGPATVNGVDGFHFRIVAVDNAEPGTDSDAFTLEVTSNVDASYAYESGGIISGGNIQVKSD